MARQAWSGGKLSYRASEDSHLGGIARLARVCFQLSSERSQRVLVGTFFRILQLLSYRRDACRTQPLGSFQLIQVGSGEGVAFGPDQLHLTLRVEIVQMYRLGRIDLVLRDKTAGQQLEDVEA